MKRAACLTLLALVTPALAADLEARPGSLDRRADVIVARTAIEARGRRHGEVRLARRGEAVVVQTLLVTRTLRRAAGRIRDKEEASWPEGSRGQGASRVYRRALASAVEEILTAGGSDRHRRLLIETVLSKNAGFIALAKPTTEETTEGIRLLSSDPIEWLEMPCAWIRRELELITEDQGLDLQKLAPLPECATP